jgi:hypothetical protein
MVALTRTVMDVMHTQFPGHTLDFNVWKKLLLPMDTIGRNE